MSKNYVIFRLSKNSIRTQQKREETSRHIMEILRAGGLVFSLSLFHFWLISLNNIVIGGERVTYRGSKLTNSQGRTKLTTPQGNNNLNFGLERDLAVVRLETAGNL